jgi:hypothetical protein
MLTMTLGTAPPTQTSDYEMVQLEHSTKLCHTRHTNTLFLGACLVKGIVFIDYAFGDRNLLNCYLILLSILLDNICITEYLSIK